MTKAAVRAMDTITAFCKSQPAASVAVEKFVVSGGSKRGWTTWTTAAVDHRVVAIVPVRHRPAEHRALLRTSLPRLWLLGAGGEGLPATWASWNGPDTPRYRS